MSKLNKELKAKSLKILADIQKLNQQVEENELNKEDWYIKYKNDLERLI